MNLPTAFKEKIASFIHETLEEYLYFTTSTFSKINNEYISYYNLLKQVLTASSQKNLLVELFENHSELYHHKLIASSITAIKYYSGCKHMYTLSEVEIDKLINSIDTHNDYVYAKLKTSFDTTEREFLQLLNNEQLYNYKLYKHKYESFSKYIVLEVFNGVIDIVSQLEKTYIQGDQ